MRTVFWSVGVWIAVFGCGDQDTEEPAAAAAEATGGFALEKLDGQWIRIDGNRGDHTHRFAFHRAGDATELWYTNGGFTKRRMEGELRKSDWRFTEILDADEAARWKSGTRDKARLYVKSKPASGGLQVTEVTVQSKDGGESEKPKGGFQEYVPFPESTPFTFRPCDGPLFLGPAASDSAEAAKQLKEEGGPFPGHALGKAIPVGVFTEAAADGDASCTYDMDLFFDDRPATDEGGAAQSALAAGDVVDGQRAWLVSGWYAPYSGNHHFQMYRYRTCEGAERTLLGVQCLEAVLE
ncbi:MAG: hypothetical protein CL927_17650 [Deltaproteobacteria bacterium]|nr:hypothetical protein [Deltaproteobacteria bacterium]HCH66548.1 hypothetical protein [Deltaproteobacteria bacterium]